LRIFEASNEDKVFLMNLMQTITAATAQRRTERRDDMPPTTRLTSGQLLQPLQFAGWAELMCKNDIYYVDVGGPGKLMDQWTDNNCLLLFFFSA